MKDSELEKLNIIDAVSREAALSENRLDDVVVEETLYLAEAILKLGPVSDEVWDLLRRAMVESRATKDEDIEEILTPKIPEDTGLFDEDDKEVDKVEEPGPARILLVRVFRA